MLRKMFIQHRGGTGELMCLENDCNTLSFSQAQKCSAQLELLSSSSPALQTSVAARVQNMGGTVSEGRDMK